MCDIIYFYRINIWCGPYIYFDVKLIFMGIFVGRVHLHTDLLGLPQHTYIVLV